MRTAQHHSVKFLMAFLIMILYASCEPKGKEKPKHEDEHEDPITVDEPREIIKPEEARLLYNTYDERRAQIIEKYEEAFNKKNKIDQKFDVARYVRFDYQTIKDYIAYIEQEAKAADVDITSLRIYLANNPVNDSSRVLPRQNSVMLSPTTKMDGEELLFYIDDALKESPKAVLLNYDFTPRDTGKTEEGTEKDTKMEASVFPSMTFNRPASMVAPYEDIKSLTLNRGSSAPPPYQ